MTVPVFGDVRAVTVETLSGELAGRDEPYAAGAAVRGRVPTDRDLKKPGLPFVQVAVDGTPEVIWPIVARSTVRITVWHADEDKAHDLAQLCMGLLLGASVDGVGYAVGTGVLPAVDDASGVCLASFTVTASMHSTNA